MHTTSFSRRRLALADGVLAVWTATWIVAVLIATEVRGLADLGATVTKAGVAVEVSADALHRLETLPVVGGQIAGPADRVVEEGGLEDPVLREILTRRAAQHLPYGKLRRASPDPWGDIREGRFHALATVELERLGVTQRPRRPGAIRA